MLTAPALPKSAGRRLLTSEEFLEWLEPGVRADLIGGEIVMHSASIAGFWVKHAWLNPEKSPAVSGSFAEILASRRPTSRRRKV